MFILRYICIYISFGITTRKTREQDLEYAVALHQGRPGEVHPPRRRTEGGRAGTGFQTGASFHLYADSFIEYKRKCENTIRSSWRSRVLHMRLNLKYANILSFKYISRLSLGWLTQMHQ